MDNDDRTSQSLWVALAGVAPIAVAGALVGLRDVMLNANVAIVLVLVVVVAAMAGGRTAGAVAAVSAALSFNFFHTRPYLTLEIDSSDDVETMLLLLALGLIVGQIVSARRRRPVHDSSGASEQIRRLHRVATLAERDRHTAEEVIMAAQDELVALLHLQRCQFEAFPFSSTLPRLGRSGVLSVMAYRTGQEGFALPPAGAELRVLGRGNVLGRFVLVPERDATVTLDHRMIAVAIADQVGAALSNNRPHQLSAGQQADLQQAHLQQRGVAHG